MLTWDVVIVGAGLAGSLAARGLARTGLSVLLVDKARFPRCKVCGCCLNPHAKATLTSVGLGELPERLGAAPLTAMRLASHGCQAALELAGWTALSRECLDAALVEAARQDGAVFLPGTMARLGVIDGDSRTVWLRRDSGNEKVSARLVLAADGLGGQFLADADEHAVTIAPGSRIGAGVVMDDCTRFFAAGTIYMAHGQGGYLGLVRLEDGRLNLAAAFDADFVRSCHGPGEAAGKLLAETGWPVPQSLAVSPCRWRGTPALTRWPRRPAAERVLALGDAAGYVEPFTGEGMAWALASGAGIVPLAERAVRTWTPALVDEWAGLHGTIVKRRQWVCRAAAWMLRHASLTRLVVSALDRLPWLAHPVLRHIGATHFDSTGFVA